MTAITKINLKDLYEIDDYLWIQKTINLLKQRKLNELDLENLIEELEDLGNEKKHRVESLLEQVIRHLLLLEYWDSEYERNITHWESEIIGFRIQLRRYLTTNLYKHLNNEILNLYQDALKFVKCKTKLNSLPSECPYNIDQLLDEDWFPKQ